MSKQLLKEIYELQSKHEAFYTGGDVEWSQDGQYLFCKNNDTVTVVSVEKGIIDVTLGNSDNVNLEVDPIYCFALSSNDQFVITYHKSGFFKLWEWKKKKIIKLWKSIHKGPVVKIALSNGDNFLMGSGGGDGGVRLWDIQHNTCIYNLKGVPGIISALAFHPQNEKNMIFAAGDDLKIHAWDTRNGTKIMTLSGHLSKITSIAFHENHKNLISSGRDQVLILWDLSTGNAVRTLPVYEAIEGIFIVRNNMNLPVEFDKTSSKIYVAAAGEKATVRVWEVTQGKEIYVQNNSIVTSVKNEDNLAVTHLIYNQITNAFAMVSVDHNIIIHSAETFECKKQLIGYSDEILDVAFIGENDSHIVVATNSCDIKLYDLSSMNGQLLQGHTDIVLSLGTTASNPQLLISSAKDNSVRLWLMNKEIGTMSCIGSGIRHTGSVGSVVISNNSNFFATVSEDLCMKLWKLPEKLNITDQDITLTVTHTILAHQKEINSVAIAPTDKLLATGSQDKTAKLWSADNLQLIATLRGHKRGVWCVRFSTVDQVLLTSSADCTIKLWSVTQFNCLKTFEGHESSVLRAEFISRGMQLLSSGGDGTIKLWNIKSTECALTLLEHESRVWSFAVNKVEDTIVSGGSDSILAIWKDKTEEKKKNDIAEKERLILEEQTLRNLLEANQLTKALNLALKLERPYQVLKIVEGILKSDTNHLHETIHELKPLRKESLLKCAVTWNTNSRNSKIAQIIINIFITTFTSEDLASLGFSRSTLEELIPYTDRTFQRMTQLLKDVHLFRYAVRTMQPHVASTDMN